MKRLRASNKMDCRTENERFFDRQGGRGKIAAGVVEATSRTILTRQRSRAEKKPFECKAILLDALSMFFVMIAVLFHSGCQYAGLGALLGTPSYHERKVPAEYNLGEHTGQKILVLVEQPGWIDAKVNFRYYLTKAINSSLTNLVKIEQDYVIPYSELSEFRSNQADFSLLSPVEVGIALDADIVLLVVLEGFNLRVLDEIGYHTGLLDVKAVLIDTATEEKLWPKSEKGKIVKVGFEVEHRGQDVAVARLVTACSYCITRCLYDCPKNKFRIADDRSSTAWQNW